MPYGMTVKLMEEFSVRLSVKLGKTTEEVITAMKEIVREDVARIAKNEIEEDE